MLEVGIPLPDLSLFTLLILISMTLFSFWWSKKNKLDILDSGLFWAPGAFSLLIRDSIRDAWFLKSSLLLSLELRLAIFTTGLMKKYFGNFCQTILL